MAVIASEHLPYRRWGLSFSGIWSNNNSLGINLKARVVFLFLPSFESWHLKLKGPKQSAHHMASHTQTRPFPCCWPHIHTEVMSRAFQNECHQHTLPKQLATEADVCHLEILRLPFKKHAQYVLNKLRVKSNSPNHLALTSGIRNSIGFSGVLQSKKRLYWMNYTALSTNTGRSFSTEVLQY